MAKIKTDIISFDQFWKEHFLSESYIDVNENMSDFLNTQGVWACFGLPKGNTSDWKCLNVGQSKTIGIEIRTNQYYSKGEFKHKKGEYKNYKGDTIFTFKRPKTRPVTTRERVWKHIGENYSYLHFIVISLAENEKERLIKEMDFAKDHEAIYWNPDPKQRKMEVEITG